MTQKTILSSGQLYWRLMQYVMPYWRMFALSIVAMVVVAATEPVFPALLKPILDGLGGDLAATNQFLFTWAPLLMIALFFVRGVATYASTYTISWVANKLVMDLRDLMFRKLISLPTRYYDDSSSGALIANVAFNVTQVTNAATSVVTVTVRDSLTLLGLLSWMFYLNWKLTLISLATAPVIAIIVKVASRRLRLMSRESQRSMGHITHVLEESIECHKVVKVFGGQDYEAQRFSDAVNEARRFSMRQMTASAANVPIVQFVAALALAVIIYAATHSVSDRLSAGSLVSFITAMLMLFAPLKRLTSVNEHLQRGLAAAEVVFEMMDQTSEPDSGTIPLGRASGELEFHDLTFSYGRSEQNALNQISLSIKPGETIALVGQSGSGKTTLVNLLPRFYAPTGGQILLDGHDITQVKLSDLRANIALVSQDVVLFNDTVAANIAYGRQATASIADIEAAAEGAHAMEFIREMPEGLQTFIGENGVRLSGGQRQRLAIARAILKNAPILILDEATSALDTQSERHVQAALENLMQNRTTIVIAHRLSTIEKADRIVVMQKGRIAEIGTHRELLEKNGVYANLYHIQFAPEAESGTPDHHAA